MGIVSFVDGQIVNTTMARIRRSSGVMSPYKAHELVMYVTWIEYATALVLMAALACAFFVFPAIWIRIPTAVFEPFILSYVCAKVRSIVLIGRWMKSLPQDSA